MSFNRVRAADNEVATAFQRSLTKQGIKFRLSTKVTGAKASDKGVALTFEPAAKRPGRSPKSYDNEIAEKMAMKDSARALS